MALRALRTAALVFLPSIALAQTVTIDPTEVNRTDCAATGNATISWQFTATIGTDKYRLVAASSCPSTPPVENGTGTLGADLTAASSPQSQVVSIASINTAVTASCTNVNDTVAKICVYWIPGGTGSTTLVNSATFTFQTAVPPAPINVSAGPANAAIEVSFGPGTTGGSFQADTVNYAVEWAPQGSTTFTRTGETTATTIRIGGLTNGTTYVARVIAFSSADNASPASATVSATPQPFLDFWSRYKGFNGREEGGCGAGGAGALAPLLLALAIFLRRRA